MAVFFPPSPRGRRSEHRPCLSVISNSNPVEVSGMGLKLLEKAVDNISDYTGIVSIHGLLQNAPVWEKNDIHSFVIKDATGEEYNVYYSHQQEPGVTDSATEDYKNMIPVTVIGKIAQRVSDEGEKPQRPGIILDEYGYNKTRAPYEHSIPVVKATEGVRS